VDQLPRRLQTNFPKAPGRNEISQAMRRAIAETNADLIALAAKDEALLNMGTTVVWAVWPPGNELYLNGVGDCRAYLVRTGRIEQLTVDHSLAQALVEAKTITPEEARSHRFRNVLWKYLGSKEVGEGTEVRVLPVLPGDRILLTTKGLTGVVSDEQLLRCVGQHTDLQKCADALGQLALDSGSRDNVSCIVIEGPAAP
jgi:protein phosphatase